MTEYPNECPICNWDIGTCNDCEAIAGAERKRFRMRIGFWITAAIVGVYLVTLFGMIARQSC